MAKTQTGLSSAEKIDIFFRTAVKQAGPERNILTNRCGMDMPAIQEVAAGNKQPNGKTSKLVLASFA